MRLARILISLILLCLAHPICASSVRVNPTGAAKGSFNLSALRDRYGFMWVGTTSGLACFDGNGKPLNNLPKGILRATANMRVTNIFEYGDDILFATPDSLLRLDRRNMTVDRVPVKTKYGVEISSQVNNICIPDSESHDIWIATQGQGIFRLDTEKNELTQFSTHGSFISDIIIAPDGNIYVSEITGKIHRYNRDGVYSASFSIPDYTQNKAMVDLEPIADKIWISGGQDIFCLDTLTGVISRKASAPAVISSIIRQDDNHLMLATASGLMDYNIPSGSLSDIVVAETGQNHGQGSVNVKVNQLRRDSSSGGILAVRQSGEILELFGLDGKYLFVPIAAGSDRNNFVNVLTPDNRKNGLWIGADDGLHYYDFSTGSLSSPAVPGLGNESITSLTTDADRIMIGTASNGLFEYNAATGNARHFKSDEKRPYSILSDEINDVFITTQGVTYILTHWGICRYNPSTDEFYTLPEIGQRTEVISMAEYFDGGLWAATVKDGLLHLKPGENRFEYFNSRNLENVSVSKLMMSRNGTLWVSTQSDGLFYYDKNSNDFEPYKLPLLANRSILAIQEDDSSNLWILTDESIIKISKDGQIEAVFRNLWPSVSSSQPFILLPDGRAVVGGNNGFRIFDSSFISHNKKVSAFPTAITFPSHDNDKALAQLGLSILLYTTDRITLPYDHNSFTIHLAANHSTDIPAVNYDYMLKGIDKDWNIGTSQSEVTYNNLPPGTYSFMVRPSGFTGVETDALNITVSPPWYMTIWAYIGYAALLILAAFCTWNIVRTSIRKQYARRIENLKIQREREVWESKMRFFVDLVHEIRTPLMLISLPLEQLFNRFKSICDDSGKLHDSEYIDRELNYGRKYLGSMQTNLDYLLGITNQLLDFRKVENDVDRSISPSSCDMVMMIEEIRERFEEPMKAEGKRLVITMPQSPVIAEIDKAKTDRVLMNLIGNARKYCRSMVAVSLEKTEDNIVIVIADDGPGIPEEHRAHIFDLYYQIKGDVVAAALGTGLGLAYARLVAQSHGGDISVDQAPQGGALFRLCIPVEAAVHTSDDSPQIQGDADTSTADSKDYDSSILTPEDSQEDIITVLVVDDNKELRDMISDGLNGMYNVITAADGIEALERLEANEVDFIVSDVMMPRMNGVELLKKVKENIDTSHIPFIILTAKATRESRDEGMENGADIYLEKPFSIKSLIHQIENIRRTRRYFYERRRGTEPLAVIEEQEKEAIKENKLPELSRFDREFLERMDKYMEENMSDDCFSIDNLAERLNMSRSSFYRKVKALVGMTPVEYVKNYRLDAAARMLRERERISDVVDNVGFSSTSYFAKCFKEKYGVLPRDYVNSIAD